MIYYFVTFSTMSANLLLLQTKQLPSIFKLSRRLTRKETLSDYKLSSNIERDAEYHQKVLSPDHISYGWIQVFTKRGSDSDKKKNGGFHAIPRIRPNSTQTYQQKGDPTPETILMYPSRFRTFHNRCIYENGAYLYIRPLCRKKRNHAESNVLKTDSQVNKKLCTDHNFNRFLVRLQ